MSETIAASGFLDKVKRWWLVWSIVFAVCGFVLGCFATGFVKFTVYYLAEQASIATLKLQGTDLATVVDSAKEINKHLARIETTLSEQHYSDQSVTKDIATLSDHVHALDARADGDRAVLNDFLAAQKKNSEQILFLLDPKGNRK